MEEQAKQLIGLIVQHADFIIGDCNTFIRARAVEKGQEQNQLCHWGTGGGNFLMAIGLFAVINFLAKVYCHLTHPEDFPTEEFSMAISDARKVLKDQSQELSPIFEFLKPVRSNEPNETTAFVRLVSALPSEIDLGFSDESHISPEDAWRTFRNALTHMVWPHGPVQTVILTNVPKDTSMREIYNSFDGQSGSAFYRSNNVLLCNSDKLVADTVKITSWLCSEIDARRFPEENIASTLEWVRI